MIAKKKTALTVAAGILLTLVGHHLAFWRGSGHVFDVIAGQFEPAIEITHRDVSVRGETRAPYHVRAKIDTSTPIHRVAPEYLSFSIDTSQVVGGKWWNPSADVKETGSGSVPAPVFDFDRPKLDLLASALAPAYLRIGGSEADKVYYDLDAGDGDPISSPDGYESTLTRHRWDRVAAFARRNGLRLVVTLNAGPLARGPDGAWLGDNAAELIEYTAWQGYPVDVWELGNELNLFWYHYGLGNQVSATQYARDLERLRALLDQHMPRARIGGQGAAFWPIVGEPGGLLFGFTTAYLRAAGDVVDLVNWHYYPQQSRRGPFAVRKAGPSRLLEPANLDEAGHWARDLRRLRDAHAPGRPIWLGETGNAQFGGEPGVSDVYVGGLWWLDQLGLLAASGHSVVVRQTLSGLDYGMIETESLEPRPDYWNSLLWKRLMGTDVYAAESHPEDPGGSADKLRLYAHSGTAGDGSVAVLMINLDAERGAHVELPDLADRRHLLYQVQTPDVLGRELLLGGRRLELVPGPALPELAGRLEAGSGIPAITIRPLSYTFAVFAERTNDRI